MNLLTCGWCGERADGCAFGVPLCQRCMTEALAVPDDSLPRSGPSPWLLLLLIIVGLALLAWFSPGAEMGTSA